jgi:hypothetical protein
MVGKAASYGIRSDRALQAIWMGGALAGWSFLALQVGYSRDRPLLFGHTLPRFSDFTRILNDVGPKTGNIAQRAD